jgi:hypothetical protein
MKKRREEYRDQIKLAEYGEPIETVENRVREWKQKFREDDTNCKWQAYLIAGFLIMEALGTKVFNLPASEFTWSQWVIMSDYEEMLMELAEEEAKSEDTFMKGQSPQMKLLYTMGFYFLMFVGVNYLLKLYPNKEHGLKLRDGLWQLMRGNKGDDPKEGPELQNNALARLIANAGKILNSTGVLGEKSEEAEAEKAPSEPPCE